MKKAIQMSVRKNVPLVSLKDGSTILIFQKSFKVILPSGTIQTLPISILKGYLEVNRNFILT